MNKKVITIGIIVVVALVIIVGGIFLYQTNKEKQVKEVANFEQCAESGYPVMESYPRQCRTPDGRVFVEKIDNFDTEKNITCNTDDDCQLINKELGFSCCWAGACEEIDYSLNKWIAVNKNWFNKEREKKCLSIQECGPAPLCPVKIINDNYRAQCINNICKKVSTVINKESCEQSGGKWGVWRDTPDAVEECNLPTSDAGKECSDSSVCESYCQVEEGAKVGSQAKGRCYAWEKTLTGCMQEIKQGIAQTEWCY